MFMVARRRTKAKNMANLRERSLSNRGAIERNRRRVEVFLEGKDDLSLFGLYWFQSLKDKVEFRCAEKGPIPTPGCNGVRDNVRHLREVGGVVAYGILDRDALPDSLEACETDDGIFLSRNANREPFIYYTLFWEIENYLIRATEMEQDRCDNSRNPELCRPDFEVYRELREHCDTLVPHAAINVHLHRRGIKKVGDGATNEYATRAEVDAFFRQCHLGTASDGDLAEYDDWLKRIDAFDSPGKPDEERVALMQRRIHGKAILQRFFNRRKIESEVRWRLARKSSAPAELVAILAEWTSDS